MYERFFWCIRPFNIGIWIYGTVYISDVLSGLLMVCYTTDYSFHSNHTFLYQIFSFSPPEEVGH